MLDPRTNPPINPVAITVRLQAGFGLGEIKSHHHAITTEILGDDTRVIRLDEKVVPADRDFELTWTPAATAAPSVGLFREHVGNADYLLAFVTPPVLADATRQPRPRETVFVIDNSGSMGGTSIVQAKASLLYALGRLKPSDRFNVIRFDHTMDVLFPDTVPADAAHIGRATAFVSALQAQGGTEMVPAMRAALDDKRDTDQDFLRQVVFLTDGEIGNEQQLFDTIAAMRGRSRVYMVGIGSAPNSFLMTRASEIGRGTFTHIGSVEQVETRMRALFDKLENPVVTGLTATYSGEADVTPGVLPDLYRGEPLVLAAKVGSLAGTLEIKGRIGDRPWVVRLPVAGAAPGPGVSKLWARRKIADAEVARTLREATPAETDRRVLDLALDHHLVSRLTSLVAVDATPSRPDGARLSRTELPLNLPAGWDFDKVFGERPSLPPSPRRGSRRRDAACPPRGRQHARRGVPAGRRAAPRRGAERVVSGRRRVAEDRDRCRAPHDARRRDAGVELASPHGSPLAYRSGDLRKTMSAFPLPPAPTLRRPSRLPTAAAAILALLGAVLFGQGAWMHVKARLAQALLESAFGTSLATGQAVKPWSWADTWPVARIEVPRLHKSAIVLEGSSGQALAFGPGHVERTPAAGEPGTAVYRGAPRHAFRLPGRGADRRRDPGHAARRKTAAFPRHRDFGRALGCLRHRSRCRRPPPRARDLLAARRQVLGAAALPRAGRDGG